MLRRTDSHHCGTRRPDLDLDAVARWCEHADARRIECRLLLDAWNFFTDVAASVPGKVRAFVGGFARYTPVYDKLFLGCNLPAVTPEGQRSMAFGSHNPAMRRL
ncbi:MAG TPA: hypothetical protein VFV34_11485 [Blastocatellia bacterium]|nr:hypothetical protein [Blastocatellia bacterium]